MKLMKIYYCYKLRNIWNIKLVRYHTWRVAGTIVTRSCSVLAIACSNQSKVPPLHMHVGSDRLHTSHQEVGPCSTRGGSQGIYLILSYILHTPLQKRNPLWLLKLRGDVTRNPERGTSGPKKGHVSTKIFFLKKKRPYQHNALKPRVPNNSGH